MREPGSDYGDRRASQVHIVCLLFSFSFPTSPYLLTVFLPLVCNSTPVLGQENRWYPAVRQITSCN